MWMFFAGFVLAVAICAFSTYKFKKDCEKRCIQAERQYLTFTERHKIKVFGDVAIADQIENYQQQLVIAQRKYLVLATVYNVNIYGDDASGWSFNRGNISRLSSPLELSIRLGFNDESLSKFMRSGNTSDLHKA